MYEVLPFEHEFIIRIPIPTDSKNLPRTTLDGNYVGLGNFVVGVIKPFDDKIGMYFIYCIPFIIGEGISTFFRFTDFYIRMIWFRVVQFYITVKLANL